MRQRKHQPLLEKSYTDPWTADRLIEHAQREADTYVTLAASKPDWMTSRSGWVDDLVREMRSAIMNEAMELIDEGSTVPMSAMDTANLQQRLRSIADEAERKIRADAMSLFDRIGAPKADRDRFAVKGAHGLYK